MSNKRSIFGTVMATIGAIVSILAVLALIAQLTGKLCISCDSGCEDESDELPEEEDDIEEEIPDYSDLTTTEE
jgi:hypothetical protein